VSPDPVIASLTHAECETAGELFNELFGQLQAIGRAPDGSCTRLAWSSEIGKANAWFDASAERLDLTVALDRNGNRWAWSDPQDQGAIITGSHLDTVPRGGSFDGALGVVCGLIATNIVLGRGGEGKGLGVVAFADEEGGRFNTPTFGSRVLTGALDPAALSERTDADGIALFDAIRGAGLCPQEMGPDEALLHRLDSFVELHIEQGTLLEELGQPIGIATSIIPHGRWRVELTGQANHGGTTALGDRRDPMVALSELLAGGRRVAEQEGALVTVGKLDVWPNAPTSIAERITAWLDVRCERDDALDRVVSEIIAAVRATASEHGVDVAVQQESRSAAVHFSPVLAERISRALNRVGIDPVRMATGAGHDAGVLGGKIPTAMLFVRNQTGISHAPQERARVEDCLTGIGALVAALDELRHGEAEVGQV
jgi:N-carbamoyl-L-amino-acid hydrolase